MMIDIVMNQIKQIVEQQMLSYAHPCWGKVYDYNPANHSAQVSILPSGITKQAKIVSQGVGNGFGMSVPVVPGQLVWLNFENGNGDIPIIVGTSHSNVNPPPSVPNSIGGSAAPSTSGQMVFVDKAGSVIRMNGDGSVYIQAANLYVNGNLIVNGNITSNTGNINAPQGDITDKHTSMEAIRVAYDAHGHTNVQNGSGVSGTPNNSLAT